MFYLMLRTVQVALGCQLKIGLLHLTDAKSRPPFYKGDHHATLTYIGSACVYMTQRAYYATIVVGVLAGSHGNRIKQQTQVQNYCVIGKLHQKLSTFCQRSSTSPWMPSHPRQNDPPHPCPSVPATSVVRRWVTPG